jgi:hypothetical protein
MCKFKIEVLVTVTVLHWHTNINAEFALSVRSSMKRRREMVHPMKE